MKRISDGRSKDEDQTWAEAIDGLAVRFDCASKIDGGRVVFDAVGCRGMRDLLIDMAERLDAAEQRQPA